jgi:hypothetical protein
MQRLALAGSAETSDSNSNRIIAYRSGIGAYFGIGLLGGGVAGAAVLLGMQVFALGQATPLRIQVPAAITGLAHWVPEVATSRADTTAPAVREPQPVDAFDVVIERSARANAPFGLRLVGSQDAGMEIVLRDVPAAAWLSRGERRDVSTWKVRAADLEDLHLTLNDGAPDAFDVRIDVLAPAGVAAASSVARVRLVGLPNVERTVTAPVEVAPVAAALVEPEAPAVTTIVSANTPSSAHAVLATRSDTHGKREKIARASLPAATTVVEIDRHPTQPAAQAEARHWPEGASGLGAVARESDRQVWWKLPAPTWSPFLAGR